MIELRTINENNYTDCLNLKASVALEYQKRGIGIKMMVEFEGQGKEMGAAMVQLVSVNDEMHEHFYGKFGYGDATNLKLKSKFLE